MAAFVPEPFWEFPLALPRHAFSAREVARPGDIWRACQDVAVWASSHQGWPPRRFLDAGTSFLVYRMVVTHDRESDYGEELVATTWVSRFRRRTLCTREIRLRSDRGQLAAATQEWAHVGADHKPTQASEETASAYPEYDGGPSAELPGYDEAPGKETRFSFEMWHTWGDPLGHANHPAYVDWCDEATSRVMREGGLDPVKLRPVAEQITFRQSVEPGQTVHVTTARQGYTRGGDIVLAHRFELDGGVAAAQATTVRSLSGGDPASLGALWDK